jgi:LysR family transcriptional regulator, hypochlorite-specific transcription factor HypT
MDLNWLEDFLSLAGTRSFSKAAEERHTTQSTLSRRIKSLEDWLGVALVDRSSYPVSLSHAGEQFRKDIVGILRSIYQARAAARSRGLQNNAPLRFGGQYVPIRHFMPKLISQIETRTELGGVHLTAGELTNCVDDLASGKIDFLICYYDASLPDIVDRHRFPSIKVGSEVAVPVSIPDSEGEPMFALPGSRDVPLPHIGYTPDAHPGWHREAILASRSLEAHLDRLYEASMAEVIREFALEGRGVAWIQATLVEDDIAQGRLVRAGGAEWDNDMEIRLFRALGPGRGILERVWNTVHELEAQPHLPLA